MWSGRQGGGAGRPTALGIDLGTSSAKAVVLDTDGTVLAQAAADYPVVSQQPGWAETDPAQWWSAVRHCVGEAVGRAGVSPAAIGLSGQMHGLVLADEHLSPVRPALLWADTRATEALSRYRALDSATLARLANPLVPGMAGPLLLWAAEHEPQLYACARWALQPKDWLRARLSGRAAAEPSDASATLLYDVPNDRWDADLMTALGLAPDLLAPLIGSATEAGTLTSAAADELGLQTGIPVAAGAADTAAAAFGSAVADPRIVQLTVGTGAQVVRAASAPVSRPDVGVHTYRSAFPAGWYQMGACMNAGIALDWARRAFDATWAELYASLDDPISATDPLFLPHLTGERTPYLDPALRASWTGISLNHDRRTLLRCVVEGVVYAIGEAFDALVGGDPPDRVRLAGGGTVERGWRQLLATVIGQPLYAVDTPAVSGRGAALLGACAAGLIDIHDVTGRLAPAVEPVAEPQAELRGLLDDRRRRFHDRTRLLNDRSEDR